jgi:hypothetical protein
MCKKVVVVYFELLTQPIARMTKGNHEKNQLGWLISELRFEPGTS